MVKRETYLAFNLYGPRLFNPPRTPPGLTNWNGNPIASLIRSLPFDRTDLAALNDETDVIQFGRVFDFRTDSDLRAEFLDFVDEFRILGRSFGSNAARSDIKEDRDFVTASKYPFALRQMLRSLVGEDFAFCFELPYLIEAEDDFLVSFELAVQGYSKQPIQILRSVLEVSIAHAHFGLRGDDFHRLAADPDFRMPMFNGPNGMLRALVDANVMPNPLAAESRTLYALMSKATHSHISHFNPDFSPSGISKDWMNLASRVGTVVTELVLRLIMRGI